MITTFKISASLAVNSTQEIHLEPFEKTISVVPLSGSFQANSDLSINLIRQRAADVLMQNHHVFLKPSDIMLFRTEEGSLHKEMVRVDPSKEVHLIFLLEKIKG